VVATNLTDASILSAASLSPSSRISIAAEQIAAIGLITFIPVYFGAEPPIGSNIETPSGLMFPPAAIPIPPCSIAPRSVIISPNMLSVTRTSNHSGFFTNHIVVASTCA